MQGDWGPVLHQTMRTDIIGHFHPDFAARRPLPVPSHRDRLHGVPEASRPTIFRSGKHRSGAWIAQDR